MLRETGTTGSNFSFAVQLEPLQRLLEPFFIIERSQSLNKPEGVSESAVGDAPKSLEITERLAPIIEASTVQLKCTVE